MLQTSRSEREISTDDRRVMMTFGTRERKVDRSVDNRFAPAFFQ
jgi:hypothetical protein